MKYRTFILFGAPGSGKGTQGKTLGSIPRFFHCPCGDVFRSIDTRTPIGNAFLEYSSKGQLVPDDITVELCSDSPWNLTETRCDGGDCLLLSTSMRKAQDGSREAQIRISTHQAQSAMER